MANKKAAAAASQQFLEIEEIREGVTILRNGEMRAVVMASGINFALRSEEEQEALLYAYRDFLNSLDFSLQVIIQSRHMNIKDYLDMLKTLEEKEMNHLLKLQITEYRDFVKSFVALENVMTKRFFVVVPFGVGSLKQGALDTFRAAFSPPKISKIPQEKFLEYKNQLMLRVEYVTSGLAQFEIKTHVLGTEELIELYWSLYNPGEGEKPFIPPSLEGATMGEAHTFIAQRD